MFAFEVVKCCRSSIILQMMLSKQLTQHSMLCGRSKLLGTFLQNCNKILNEELYKIVILTKSHHK